MIKKAGLYIHVPFCVSKCAYCDFLSFESGRLSSPEVYAAYRDALLLEMRRAHETYLKDWLIDTVYIGGGTPTAMPAPFLLDILKEIQKFTLTSDAEITVEANPGTLSAQTLAALKKGGANRLSIGLQAWQDRLLAEIGRIHTQSDFVQNFLAARELGFNNINVDLMFALPGQTAEDWQESLGQLAALAPEHISAYGLTVEEGTVMGKRVQRGEIPPPDESTDRDMYEAARTFLEEQGYRHYELSNFAKPGYQSRHNTRYWRRSPYFGFGLGAHSFTGSERRNNTTDLNHYLNTHGLAEWEDVQTLSREDAMSETMFLGLRMTEGVSETDFFKYFGVSLCSVYGQPIEELIKSKLLERADGYIRLTRRGMDLANQVFIAFV